MGPPSSGSGGGGGSGGRCYVSSVVGFLLALLTLVLVIGVALVVFFSSSRSLEVTCRRRLLSGDPGSSTGALQDAVISCKSWVENGGNASESICHACPSWQTSTTTPSAMISTAPPPYDRSQYRLPSTVSPLHYSLRLQPHIYHNDPPAFFFQGSVTIDVICHDVTDLITLHANHLTIEDSDVTVQEKASGLSVNVRKILFEDEPQFVRIHLRESLRQGVKYRIVIARFSGPLRTDKQGLYVSSYLDGNAVVYLAATRFNAIYARKAFPCFDEPSKKATFDVTLVRRMDSGRNYHTLSNTERVQTFASSSVGWVEDVYQTTVRMSTHQLTFLISDFDHVTNTTMGVRISMWAPRNAMPFTGRAQELGRRIFQSLETRFVPSYSSVVNKLDMVSVPGLGYGVEGSVGLVLYGDNFLSKPALATMSNVQFTGLILTHTLSHLWFGTLVTPAWWNWQWMSESMASFCHMTLLDDLFSNWRMTEEHIVGTLHGVMTSDALASSRPLTADVESPGEISSLVTDAEIDRLLSDVNYGKGPFIIRLIHFIMGQDRFLEALNNYVSAHKFENVQPEDLWAAFNNVSLPHVDIGQKMNPWVTQMGYPVVMVTRTGRGRLRLQQQRFWAGSEEGGDVRYKDPPSKYQWEIPITVTSSQNPNFTQTGEDIVWMEKDKPLTSVSDPTVGDDDQAWFIVNVQQFGYYRVSYDHRNWINLIRQLNADHKVIHPINRAQIINDAWNLVKADMLDMDTALKTVDFLSKEVDYLPWRAFALEMYYVQTMLEQTDLYGDLQTFMVNLVTGPLQQLGLDITPDLDPLSVYTRMQLAIFACRHGHPTCVRLAQQQLKEWRVSGQNGPQGDLRAEEADSLLQDDLLAVAVRGSGVVIINPNLRRYLYCTGVERGGAAEWNFMLQQYWRATEAEERGKRRHALACAREPALLYRLLTMAMEGNTSQSLDVSQVIRDVSANPWGRDIAFQFLGQHFSPLVALLGTRLNGVINSITAHFNSDYDLHRLSLLESTGDTSAFASAFKQARTKTQTNMDWLRKHRTTLQKWLQPKEQKEEKINYRLPGDVVPRHYRVELQPHLYGSDPGHFFFEGSVTIRVQCIVSTPLLTLHVHRLNISDTDISVRQVNSWKELFRSSSYDQLRQFWHLRLTDSLQAGKTYLVEFRHFSGPLTTEGYGLYLSYYRDGENTVYLATSQSDPVNARKVFPCFDEPQLKATFDITLVRRNDTERHYISLSNAPLSKTSYIQDSRGYWWAKDRFDTTPIMSTYILAFIVCDFVHLRNTTASDPNVTISTYARPNAIQWAEKAQVCGVKAFDWLNRRFKPPYGQALAKLDNVAIPDFTYGAMENWGLVIYREAILYQSDVTSASGEFRMAYVLAHEMAHKWFGNYVSPKWYDWMWMNEALASWWGVFVTDQIFPHWTVTGRWVSESLYPIMEADALLTSRPMTADVQTRDDIYNVFDDIIYSKGAAVIRMMHFIMGLDTFVDGLNLYLANNVYGNVETADLLTALDQKMREQHFGNGFMTEKMDPWISQMGFPVVMVTRTPRGYQLTQKRFLIGSQGSTDARYENAPYNYQWEIPIIYATSDNTNMAKSRDDIHWLSKNRSLILPEASVNDSNAWILINIDQMAYCRVLYDAATWRALISQLNRDPSVIPAISRGQIINDAWNLAKAGLVELSVALSTLDFLESESDLVPWSAISTHMDFVQLMLHSTDLFPPLQTYMRRILQKPLQTLTLNIENNMAPSDVFVRTLIAEHACKFGLAGCVNTAKRLFRDWKNTGFNQINVNLRRQFYCTAVAEGVVTDWQFVYGQYRSADDASELSSLRHALSCSRDPVLLRRVLNMALDPAEVRTQDLVSTLRSVSANPQGRSLTFRFCLDHWATLLHKVDLLYLGEVLISVTSHFNTEYDLQQLRRLQETRNVSGVISAVEQAVAQTRTNMAWMQTNYPQLRHWLTSASPSPAPAAPVGSYRLPPHLSPYHYDVSLRPHIYGQDPKQFFFEGNVTIFVTCTSPTPIITLHQDRLTIDPSTITVTDVIHPGASLPVDDVTEEEWFQFYKIHLRQSLRAGGNYSLQFLNFRGDIRNDWQGLFFSSYKEGDKTIYMAATQLQPTHTRQVFPCFDEPALKATCAVTLVRRTDTDRRYITLSNMPRVSSTALDGQWTADVFQRTMRMPIYLLAFVVCDFTYLANSSAKYPVQIRTYAPRQRIEEARAVQDYSVQLFEWYNDHFEPNYETFLSKLDQIAIPNLRSHAMENWGLITYRARPMLYNSMSTVSDRAWIAEVPSHELAHMWFGNKVSPKWWTWIWLNEGLSDYWQNYAVEQLYPDWKDYSVVYKVTAEFYAMRTDSYGTSHPLSHYVEIPEEIRHQFDTIAYLKGAAIAGMMHMIMGEHFIPALNVYLTDNQLGVVEHKDLFDSMNKYIGGTTGIDVNMTEKMEPWVTQMGYPVVNVHRQGDQMTLTQRRFLLGSSSPTDTGTYGYKFEIPITYTTSSEKNFTKSRTDILWLRADGSSLTIPMTSPNDDWVAVNLRHEGYYRVNYDVTTWKALIAQLNADHTVFHEVNRAALIDDAFNLAKAELLPLEIALQTVNYMKKETDYGPLWVFSFNMDQLELMIERTELFADFQRFIQNLVDEPLKTVGFDPPPDNDPPIDVLKMSTIISYACKYDHVTCVTKATGLVSDWMNGLDNKINVNLRSTIYCTAVREGGHDVWEFIYHKYQTEKDEMEKSRLRSSLGCAKDPTTLYTFLDACLSGEGEPSRSETSRCLSAVADSRYGRDVALNFLLQHFPLLKRRFSAGTLGRMVSTVTQHFHDKFHLAQLQHLVDRYDLSGISDTVDTVRQRILTNMRWMDKNLRTVQQWLADKSPRPATKLSYRLPTAVIPYHYDLELQPEIYGLDPSAFTFNGTVTIFIRIREPATTITLHSHLLDERTIQESARLLFDNGTDSGYLQEVTFDASRHFLSLALSRELRVNESFRLYLEFWGALRSGGMGLYYTSYKANDGDTVYLVNTEFSRTFAYARRTFPCFDEPAMKATVNVTLVRNDVHNGRTYRAWSNNELLYTENRANGYVADHFQTTPVMPTYALVFIVADFRCLSNVTKHAVTYRTCARPNAYYQGHWSQNWGMKALEWLEDHLDPPYPLAKIDNVAIPDLRSFGLEGWGLVPYREYILYQGGTSLTIDKEVTATTTAHNFAHMWFGNLVTPEWWNWLWLKEAFTYFWHHLLLDILQPRWRQVDKFVVTLLHQVMSLDSMTSSHPVTADVESPMEVAAIFDPVTYGKGTAVIRLIHFLMGQDNFIAGLNVYLGDHQYGSVNHTHLFEALDKYLSQQGQGLRRMSEVMEPWVTQMGYPVVHVQWSERGQVTLTQRRFLATGPGTGQRKGGSEHSAPFGYTWDIPIIMATSVNTNYNVSGNDVIWFNKTDPQLTISRTDIPTPSTQGNRSTWVLVNVQQFGYYRVNYPDSNWLALIRQLKTDPSVIHPVNRAQIINDAWSFARSGHLSMGIALQTLQVLKNDGDYVPWQAMSGELRYLDLMLSRKEVYGMFEDYVMQLVSNTYEDMGMTSGPSDPPMQIYQRQAIVTYACRYGVHRCRQETTRRFSAWKSGIVNNELEVDMRRVILCNGVRFGDKEDWNFVYEHCYLNATPGSAQQSDCLSALACSSQAWLLQRLLDLTLNSTVVMAQDVRSVLESVSANPIGRDMAFTFLKRHFYRLLKLMTAGNLGSVVVTLTQHFNTQHELDEVKLFMSRNDVSMTLTSFRQVVEQTSANIKWMQDYYHQICHFLQDRSNW